MAGSSGNAGLYMQGAGGATSAIGSIIQGEMQGRAMDFQADVNATNAVEALDQGAFDAQRSRMLAAHRIGAAKAGYAASGVSIHSGSAASVLMASAASAELDRLNILHGADLKATNFQNQEVLDRQGAESSRIGGFLGGIGGLLTSGAALGQL